MKHRSVGLAPAAARQAGDGGDAEPTSDLRGWELEQLILQSALCVPGGSSVPALNEGLARHRQTWQAAGPIDFSARSPASASLKCAVNGMALMK